MKVTISSQAYLVIICILITGFRSDTEEPAGSSTDLVLIGSTPGDPLIKSFLSINPGTVVDFIRWDLSLMNKGSDGNNFELNLQYGESQPNTLGFKGGGEKLFLKGKYFVTRKPGSDQEGSVFQLVSDNKPAVNIALMRLDENIFHLLTPDNHLMVGNGGWSYTLNRKNPVTSSPIELRGRLNRITLINDTARKIIFEGRTPCAEIAKESDIKVSTDCFKLKWQLTLNRDPKTSLPTSYVMNRTNIRGNPIQGKWSIINGSGSGSSITIYQLNPEKPGTSIFLLAFDENVLFFLSNDNRLMVGNADFSYTLNKKFQTKP